MPSSSNTAQQIFSGAGAAWSHAASWSGGSAPTSTQDAFVGAGATGAASADVMASVTVNSIAINAASTLTVDYGSTFTATNGSTLAATDVSSLGVGNAGTLDVTANATLAIGGNFVNSGGVEIACANLADSGNLKLIGNVTLSGGGHVDLGAQVGAASTTAPVSGGGLVNVDNVISGAGAMTLATLDNRAGGAIVASQSYADDLALDIAQMSNEGALRVATGAAMVLGHAGQTRSLANSGLIAVGYEGGNKGANAQLLIGGNYTISGSGALDLMGSDDFIMSNQTPTTFTNAGAILATATSQIGDGGQGFDDLTFVNAGSTVASGANVTLTLDTHTLVIADTGVLEATGGATLALNSEVDLSGAGAWVEAGAGGVVQIDALVADNGGVGGIRVDAGGKVTLSAGATISAPVTIDGASGAAAGGFLNVQAGASLTGEVDFAGAGGKMTLVKQSGLTVGGDGGAISLAGSSVTVTGSGVTVAALGSAGNAATIGGINEVLTGAHASFALLAGATATLTGNDDTVSLAAGASLATSGTGGTLSGASASFALLGGASAALTGGGDSVSVASGATLTVSGAGNTITASANAHVSVGGDYGSSANNVNGDGAVIAIAAGAHAGFSGDDDTVVIGANALVWANGADDIVQGSDDKLFIAGHQVLTGSHNQLIVSAGAVLDLNGADDKVHLGVSGATVNLSGTANRLIGAGFSVTAASGADFWMGASGPTGAANIAHASNATIRVGGNSNAQIVGNDDAVAALAHSNVTLDGAGIFAHFGRGSTASVGGNGAAGPVDTLTGAYYNASILSGSNVLLGTLGADVTVGDDAVVTVTRTANVVTAGARDSLDVHGLGNEIVLGMNGTVTDNGNGSLFVIGGAVGTASLSGFGSDDLGIVDLANGSGGFATANAAYAALVGDGAGGVELSLGTAGVIDFVGTAASQLSAANFRIG